MEGKLDNKPLPQLFYLWYIIFIGFFMLVINFKDQVDIRNTNNILIGFSFAFLMLTLFFILIRFSIYLHNRGNSHTIRINNERREIDIIRARKEEVKKHLRNQINFAKKYKMPFESFVVNISNIIILILTLISISLIITLFLHIL